MRRILAFIAVTLLLVPFAIAQDLQLPRVSQNATVKQTIGLTDVTITYSRPGVKGRVIWGNLVPYDKIWRTGANEATTISVSKDVKINGQPLPAGTYSLHTIPGKTEWTLIFNKVAKQWGSFDYKQSEDAIRVKVKPESGPMQEWMQFSFPDVQPNSATAVLAWEKVRVPFTIETDTLKQAMDSIQKALSGEVKNWEVPYDAAEFVFTNKGDKAQGMKWLDQSIGLKETFWNLRLKADMLAQDGKKKEAIETAEKAVKIGKENKDEPSEVEKTEKQLAEWKAGN